MRRKGEERAIQRRCGSDEVQRYTAKVSIICECMCMWRGAGRGGAGAGAGAGAEAEARGWVRDRVG